MELLTYWQVNRRLQHSVPAFQLNVSADDTRCNKLYCNHGIIFCPSFSFSFFFPKIEIGKLEILEIRNLRNRKYNDVSPQEESAGPAESYETLHAPC